VTACARLRRWRKSKESGRYVHSRSASSISNVQFGGTHCGCTGLRWSVPNTTGAYDAPEVCPDHLRRGVPVCHIDRPDSGAGADIEDALWVFDWGFMQVLDELEEDLVVEVEAVLLRLLYISSQSSGGMRGGRPRP